MEDTTASRIILAISLMMIITAILVGVKLGLSQGEGMEDAGDADHLREILVVAEYGESDRRVPTAPQKKG